MKTPKSQLGMSTSNLILVIGLIGFFLTLLFKLGPAYLDNKGVRAAMKSMVTNYPEIHEMEKDRIHSQLSSYFTINGIRDINVKDIKIVRNAERTLLNHEYEKRIHLFLNIDVVLSFRNQMDSSNLEECCKFLVENVEKK